MIPTSLVSVPSYRHAHPSAESWKPNGPSEILLIDDDPSVRESLQRVLTTEGLHVIAAAGGRDALEYLSEKRPALIITDLCMAPLTGWDLMLHLGNHHPELPIFVVTALPPRSTGGADLIAAKFFQKPIDLDALLAAIRRQLGSAEPIHRSIQIQDTP